MEVLSQESRPVRLLRGTVEYVFQRGLAAADPKISDYMVVILLRFLRTEDMFCLRNRYDVALPSLLQMHQEAMWRVGEAQWEARQHVGDLALFITGFFDAMSLGTAISNRLHVRKMYRHFGTNAYKCLYLAGGTEDVVYRLLQSKEGFRMCVKGLRKVREELAKGEPHSSDGRPFLIF